MTTYWPAYLSAVSQEFERSRDRPERLFPHYSEKGRWELLDVGALSSWQAGTYEHGNWTAGFWFGNLWLAALGTGDARYADLARERLPLLAPRADDTTTHDLGFLFYPSFVLGHLCGFLTDEDVEPALAAARMTVRRFNDTGRFIQAFGPVGEARSAETSTIDTMMNLPLLWWAHAVTGEARFLEVARHHARTSARLLIRPDASAIHLMRLDPVTGAYIGEETLQGAAADSAWARGLGWAIGGFAWSYAVSGELEMLSAAERVSQFYLDGSGAGQLPPWDFHDDSARPIPDASAAAAVAVGYQILGAVHPDESRRDGYLSLAQTLLQTLGRDALNGVPDVDGVLLRSNYSVPHGRGVDGATAWGDFYVGLALALEVGVLTVEQILGTTVFLDTRKGSP